ncbi:MAG: DEAD/DEAH box helicase, partial [Chloroflexota bacterium]
MSEERLEWLDLSTPSEKKEKKPALKPGDTPCPRCGWPVAAGTQQCTHCKNTIAATAEVDLLAALNIQLPDPVIEVDPPPDSWFADDVLDSPAMYQLRLRAEQLKVTTGFDHLICLDDISVENYQHQVEAALRALRDMRGRALLADEVGLGKTIEAGIVMKELIERGLVRSILVLTPASLTWQWQEEMDAKFHEEFEVLESLKQLPPDPEEEKNDRFRCRWIVSLDRAKSSRWAKRLLAREYDLLIIDEAHKLKNHRTQAYKFVNQIRKRYVLMLTATPIHNDLMELYNLITILQPGHLGTRKAFQDNFIASDRKGPRYRVLTWKTRYAWFSDYLSSPTKIR